MDHHDTVPPNPQAFAQLLRDLRLVRRNRKAELHSVDRVRHSLSTTERELIFRKTGGRCHICGGGIEGNWHADHVLPHSVGGGHLSDNYLPAHSLCNNYRWNYTAEEFQQILKLGCGFERKLSEKRRLPHR